MNPPKKVRNTARSALILVLVNPQDSEVSKMVCIAIVARLDPAQRMQEVALICGNQYFCLVFVNILMNSTKSTQLEAFNAPDLDVLQ